MNLSLQSRDQSIGKFGSEGLKLQYTGEPEYSRPLARRSKLKSARFGTAKMSVLPFVRGVDFSRNHFQVRQCRYTGVLTCVCGAVVSGVCILI